MVARHTDNNSIHTNSHSKPLRLLTATLSLALSACSQLPWQQSGVDAGHDAPANQELSYTSIEEITAEQNKPWLHPTAPMCIPESGVAWMDPEHSDLWERIRHGYGLNLFYDNPRISAELDWFGAHQKYINRVIDRATPYLYYIVQEIERHELPMEVALLPIVESAYDPFAYSHAKAAGIWQFIPSTGELYGLKQNWWYDGRRDIRESTRAAIHYLSYLSRHYKGDWELALAAYNTGMGNVDRAIRRNRKKGLATDFWSLKLPRETSAYVPRLLAVARIVAEPATYSVNLKHVPNAPYFDAVDIGSQIELSEAARMAEITTEQMYRLNPGFNRWATDPRGPFELLVPKDKAEKFRQRLASQAAGNRVSWQRYQVAAGDSLGRIARNHNTSVNAIREINQLNGSTIYAGRTLLIPHTGTPGQRGANSGKAETARRIEYKVSPGDSIWKIAHLHKVSEQQVRDWNNLERDAPILAGSKLVLWQPQRPAGGSGKNTLPATHVRKVG